MVRQIFKGRVIAAAGPLPGQFTVDKLKIWTSKRKGVFRDDFDDDVTHLLCTQEQFEKKVPRVREALERGKSCHLVHLDWFEFSTVKEKRQPEQLYSMRSIHAKHKAKKREQARIEKGKRDGEKFVNTNFYHIYTDRSNFDYQISITRDDEDTGEMGQRYTLCLWESNASPHLYWFTAKFLKRRGDSQPSYHRPSSCPGKWRAEFDKFQDFFQIKTGINWEDRVTLAMTKPSPYFQYAPPEDGSPVGRRLRFSDSEYCWKINAELRGLPWPRPKETAEMVRDQDVAVNGPIVCDDDEREIPSLGDEEARDQDGSSSDSDEEGAEPQDIGIQGHSQSPPEGMTAKCLEDVSSSVGSPRSDSASQEDSSFSSSQTTLCDSENPSENPLVR
ncbi:hypothetical protein ACJZ2D_014737 [Fusarium nematophilum]